MAEYLLRNGLNPSKVVACSVTFRQMVNKGEEGQPVWLIEIVTLEQNKDGSGSIAPVYIHYTDDQNLDAAISEGTEKIAQQVDWAPLVADVRPPFVVHYEPTSSVVGIHTDVVVDIKDIQPAAGIDPNSVEMTVNGIDVSGELELVGDPYDLRLVWRPKIRVYE